MSLAGVPPAALQAAAGGGASNPQATQAMLASLLGGSPAAPPLQKNVLPQPEYQPQGMVSPWWKAQARQLTFNPQEGRVGMPPTGTGTGKGGAPQPPGGPTPPPAYGGGGTPTPGAGGVWKPLGSALKAPPMTEAQASMMTPAQRDWANIIASGVGGNNPTHKEAQKNMLDSVGGDELAYNKIVNEIGSDTTLQDYRAALRRDLDYNNYNAAGGYVGTPHKRAAYNSLPGGVNPGNIT